MQLCSSLAIRFKNPHSSLTIKVLTLGEKGANWNWMNGAEIFVEKDQKEQKCAALETKEGDDWKKQVTIISNFRIYKIRYPRLRVTKFENLLFKVLTSMNYI